MLIIKKFLDGKEIEFILSELKEWKEGFTNSTKEHKDNYESNHEALANKLATKIKSTPEAFTKLFIKSMTLPRFNKYEVGQKYSKHIDAFKQSGIQTDWSYTLILEPAEKGGELEINIEGEDRTFKLEAGDIIFYPSGNIHQVKPVTKGTRIAAIGWIESLITRNDQQKIISHIIDVMQKLDGTEEHKDNVLKLSYSYHNLMRLWSK